MGIVNRTPDSFFRPGLTWDEPTALARVEADFQTAARREAMIQQKYSAQYQDTAAQTNKMVRYNALRNEAEEEMQAVERLQEESRRAREQARRAKEQPD